MEEVSLKLGPSYSTTTSTLRITFGTVPRSELANESSSPVRKYAMASVRSTSFLIENSSPSSSVYVRKNDQAEREKHSST